MVTCFGRSAHHRTWPVPVWASTYGRAHLLVLQTGSLWCMVSSMTSLACMQSVEILVLEQLGLTCMPSHKTLCRQNCAGLQMLCSCLIRSDEAEGQYCGNHCACLQVRWIDAKLYSNALHWVYLAKYDLIVTRSLRWSLHSWCYSQASSTITVSNC